MKKNIIFLIVIISVAVGAFIGFRTQYRSGETATVAAQAPDILVRDYHPTIGEKTAPVTIVEFLDPECESCRIFDPTIKGLVQEFSGKVFFVVRYMPLHQNSVLAAASLEETRASGKYFQALSLLFYRQPEWAAHHEPKPELIPGILKNIDVDISNIKPEELIAKHKTE